MDSASSRSIRNPASESRANRAAARRWPRLRRTIWIFCWLYLAALLVLCGFIRIEGDRWWPATLILFGPRWIWALPMGILVPLALLLQRRSLWVLGCAAVVIVGPVMGLCIGFGTAGPTTALRLRVLTCNVHEGQLDAEAMKQLIADTHPDIVALQECYLRNPTPGLVGGNWNVASNGQFTLGSRYPIRVVHVSFDRHAAQAQGTVVAYAVEAPGATVRFFSVHLTSPHASFRSALHLQRYGGARVEVNSRMRSTEAQDLRAQAEGFAGPVLLAGDFNNWTPQMTPMISGERPGDWRKLLQLSPGRYKYRLVVDGRWVTDPNNTYVEANQFGELDNVIEVGRVASTASAVAA